VKNEKIALVVEISWQLRFEVLTPVKMSLVS
jgi:hypothetical protein